MSDFAESPTIPSPTIEYAKTARDTPPQRAVFVYSTVGGEVREAGTLAGGVRSEHSGVIRIEEVGACRPQSETA